MTTATGHTPVLLAQSLQGLTVRPGMTYLDLTFGRGGHTRGILAEGGEVVALDQDQEAIVYGRTHFVKELENGTLNLICDNFRNLTKVLQKLAPSKRSQIYGVLADFGTSSNQLDEADRGFSFKKEATLDMRMDKHLGVTAKDLVNALGKNELVKMLVEFAQETHAKVIAQAIVDERRLRPIQTTLQLANLIEKRVPRRGHLHPATKTFMALRMLVNDETGAIQDLLPQGFDVLVKGGRMVMISFQESEDRLVKHFFKSKESVGQAKLLTKKPITASQEEVDRNNRARSAKLRILEKIV